LILVACICSKYSFMNFSISKIRNRHVMKTRNL
jgi:hypothetical protein